MALLVGGTVSSSFGLAYQLGLRDWAEKLQSWPGMVVAIARKGPKLLKLMVQDGFLPQAFLGRVTTEKALPFIDRCPDGIVIFDDGVIYGATYVRVHTLADIVTERCLNTPQVTGLPFAVCKQASIGVRQLVTDHAIDLSERDVAPFIRDQIVAYRLLGEPLDIEHPIIGIHGDFQNVGLLEIALEQSTDRLQGELVRLHSQVPTPNGIVPHYAWSILLKSKQVPSLAEPDIHKLRVYLDPTLKTLRVTAMRPYPLGEDSLSLFAQRFPGPLYAIWKSAETSISYDAREPMATANWQSLAMWTNYLASVCLLHTAKQNLVHELSGVGYDVQWQAPSLNDLQLLIGPKLAPDAEIAIAQFLDGDHHDEITTPTAPPAVNLILSQRVPKMLEATYRHNLQVLTEKALDVSDNLKALFHAERQVIRASFQDGDVAPSVPFEFGITFSGIIRSLRLSCPQAEDRVIHRWFDRLIDEGFIVPAYMNMTPDGFSRTWTRVFRVGEGAIENVAHLLLLLYEALQGVLGDEAIPVELFEKFCVLAITAVDRHKDLAKLHLDEVEKRFYLYGARLGLNTGQREIFLLEWAVEHQKIFTSNSVDHHRFLTLNPSIRRTYPASECPWDEDVQYAVKQLAMFIKLVHDTPRLKDRALVMLTSIATRRDLHRALETELDLWLHDLNASVYHSLQALSYLASQFDSHGKAPSGDALKRANEILRRTANFTRQVETKLQIDRERDILLKSISDNVEGIEEGQRRIWTKILSTLTERSRREGISDGLTQIASALWIAHRTNSILRDMLSAAGYRDPEGRGGPIEESIQELRDALDDKDRVDDITRVFYAERDGDGDLDDLLYEVMRDIPSLSFSAIFDRLRPIILLIAERAELIVRSYGTSAGREQKEVLEPPHYIVMWDIRGSSRFKSRDILDEVIGEVNGRIKAAFGDRITHFRHQSRDDGNGLICREFQDVLAVFQLLCQSYATAKLKFPLGERDIKLRVGCAANLLGRLNYYPGPKAIGGRAYEYAARVTDLFKELKDPQTIETRWIGDEPPQEPEQTYMVIEEFAFRFAEQQEWELPDEALATLTQLEGSYLPRVEGAIPIGIWVLENAAKGHERDHNPADWRH